MKETHLHEKTADKPIKCCECEKNIPKGRKYLEDDREFSYGTYSVCLPCAIREGLAMAVPGENILLVLE